MANPLILMINVGSQEQSEEECPLERALRNGDEEESELMHILRMMLSKMPGATHAGGGGGN